MKYGFIYLWYDRKHKRYYLGSHWGTEDDGYICSSNWMRDAYRRRPEDFRRKIVKRIYTDHKSLLKEEDRFLKMIKDEEIGKRFYNLKKNTFEHAWYLDENQKLSVGEKIGKANIISQKGKTHSEETKAKMRGPRKSYGPQSEEHKEKLSKLRKGSKRKPYKKWSEESRKTKSLAMRGNTRRLGTGKTKG